MRRPPNLSIIHADALEELQQIESASIDLCLTDPPYVIGAVSHGNMTSKSGGWGDMMNSSRWFRNWYAMVRRALKPTGAMWTFTNWRSLPVVMKAASDLGWPVTSVLVWDKDWIGPGGPVGLRPSYELVVLMAMPEFRIPNRSLPDIRTVKWSAYEPTGHPAEKPVALLEWIIRESLPGGGLILDPFCGSGSTLVAAGLAGCDAIGIEQEDRWVDIARERLSKVADDGNA